jgi:D-alanine-D-alanine ligase
MSANQTPRLCIGLTFDLADEHRGSTLSEEELAEFDSEQTIEGIEGAIRQLGHQTERIGSLMSLVKALAAGKRWDLVFNIAEGRFGAARESQVPALLDGYSIPYTFSDPLVLGLALHKAHAKAVVRAAGVRTADYLLVERLDDIRRCNLGFPLFAKPVAEGTSKGVSTDSIVEDPSQLKRVCGDLLARFQQPVLLETYLPGREFTVGVLGAGSKLRSLGTLEVLLVGDADVGVYSYRNKKQFVGKVEYRWISRKADPLVEAVEAVALAAYVALGCRDAGRVDVRLDAQGLPCFIEVNPLPGLNPEVSDLAILVRHTGFGYGQLISAIVNEALRRVPANVTTDVEGSRHVSAV